MPQGQTKKRGRPPKFDTDTALELLVTEGVKRLRASGYEPGLGAVSLDHAIKATHVPRGAAYRLLNHDERAPQEQYRAAVLMRIFDTNVAEGVFRDLDQAIENALGAVQGDINSTDPLRRLHAIRAIIRMIAEGLQDAVHRSDAFRMSRSLARAADGTLRVPDEVDEAMQRADMLLLEHYVDIMQRIFALFDAHIRAPFTFEHVIVLVNALNDGLLDRVEGPAATTIQRPTGIGGAVQEWSLFAVGYEALIAFFSDDPALRQAIEEESA